MHKRLLKLDMVNTQITRRTLHFVVFTCTLLALSVIGVTTAAEDGGNVDLLDLATLQQRAEAGDAIAQTELAGRYQRGIGLTADSTKAATWYLKSAQQGNAAAELSIAQAYRSGVGVCQNDVQALYWFRTAAEQGNAIAQWHVGEAYTFGRGAPRDTAQAHIWLKRAAQDKSEYVKISVERTLLAMNHPDNGVATNQEQIAVKAAGSSCTLDLATLKQRATTGDTAAQATLADTLARDFALTRENALRGDADAEFRLSRMLSTGTTEVARDDALAVSMLRKAAVQGHIRAEFLLAQRYEFGYSVPQDLTQAIFWCQKAAADADPDAQQKLPSLIAKQSATASSMPSSSEVPRPSKSDDRQLEIQDRIESLQSDIESHEEAAQRSSDLAQNLQSSGCSGPASALCASIGQVGVARAQADANREINLANQDRAEIRRLQGEAAVPAQQLDTSLAGNLQQVTSQSPAPSILDAANQQASAMRAIGDTNAARQQHDAQLRLASQRATLQTASQRSNIVAGPPSTSQASVPVMTSSTRVQYNVSSSNSSVASGAIQYSTPLATSCVRQFWDPNAYNWLSFENNCGQAIYVNYIPHRPGGWAMGGGMHLAPGNHNNTGLSSAEINQTGGFDLYVCPTDSVPVDLSGNTFNTNVAEYRCKPQ